jgi:hypothetical protein
MSNNIPRYMSNNNHNVKETLMNLISLCHENNYNAKKFTLKIPQHKKMMQIKSHKKSAIVHDKK